MKEKTTETYLSTLLANDPDKFQTYIKDEKNRTEFHDWIAGKCKSENNNYSPPIHQLVSLTGRQKDTSKDGIPPRVALDIFAAIADFVDPEDTDGDDNNIENFIANEKVSRGNEEIIRAVCRYFAIDYQEPYVGFPPTCAFFLRKM